MTLFVFDIRETLSRRVMIKADSMEEAWDEVDRMYMESEIVLNADDFGARLVETQAMSKSRPEGSRCEHG